MSSVVDLAAPTSSRVPLSTAHLRPRLPLFGDASGSGLLFLFSLAVSVLMLEGTLLLLLVVEEGLWLIWMTDGSIGLAGGWGKVSTVGCCSFTDPSSTYVMDV